MKIRKKIWKIVVIVLLLTALASAQTKTVSVPEEELTEQQKARFLKDGIKSPSVENAHAWVGLGKEIGEAFNSSLGAFTDQADRFSRTNVGKFAMVVVAWKVIGNEATHFLAGLLELLVFVPFFCWSYRKTCMTRRIVLSKEGPFWNRKKTWETIPYEVQEGVFQARHGHMIMGIFFIAIWTGTVFSY